MAFDIEQTSYSEVENKKNGEVSLKALEAPVIRASAHTAEVRILMWSVLGQRRLVDAA